MEPPPNSYLRSLGALLSSNTSSHRVEHAETLISLLPNTTPEQAPLIATLTIQTLSQFFTTNDITTVAEALLQTLLRLLCGTFHQAPPTKLPQIVNIPTNSVNTTYHSIYPAPYPDIAPLSTAFENPSSNLQLATAHLLHLLTTLSTAPTPVSRLAFHTIASLARILPSNSRAAFLPGLVSNLTKTLSNAVYHHSTVCIAALDALHVILSTLNTPLSRVQQQHLPQQKNKPRFEVIPDTKWKNEALDQASPRITNLLTTSSGPLHHTSPRVREYLTIFLYHHLKHSTIPNSSSQALLRITLLTLAGDDFPSVQIPALKALQYLFNNNNITLHHLHNVVHALLSSRITPVATSPNHHDLGVEEKHALHRLSTADPSVWTHVATGYLNVLVPNQQSISVVPTTNLPSSVAIIGPEAFCNILTELLSRQWVVTEGSAQAFATALDCLVLRAGASLGKAGLLTSLFSTLVQTALIEDLETADDAPLQRFRERAYAVLLLQAVLHGEIGRDDVVQSQVHQRLVYECTKETLQLMNAFFLPSTDVLDSTTTDDSMISMKHCLLVCTARLFEDLADLHRRANIRPLGADITLIVLMSLLRDASNGEFTVRKTAKQTINRISKAIGWKNERKLLFRHLNYIIGRVIRNLDKKWAGDVLRFVIGNQGDDVSREATVLLETTFQRMNQSLAGASDETALTTMNSIINILSTAVTQKHAQQQDSDTTESHNVTGRAAEEILYQNDLSDLRRALFEYCTDDIPNYDKLTSKVELINRSYLEDDENNGESKHDAFETIATHALEGTRDILVGRPWNVCAASLLCATLSVKLLEGRRRILLPFAAKILPLLPDQFVVLNEELTSGQRMLRDFRRRKFGGLESGDNVEDLVTFLNNKGKQLPVVTNACLLLAAFAAYAGSFIRDRFVRLIYPKLRPLLRLAECFPTLLVPAHTAKSTSLVSMPSYGAMSACDACLEAIACVAIVAPDVLAPFASSLVGYLAVFFDPKFDPAISPKRQVVHTNRSMVRFECERWVKRAEFAETIVRQLKIVNANDVMTTLLKCDDSAPSEIKPVHESLHAVHIPQSKSRIKRSSFK